MKESASMYNKNGIIKSFKYFPPLFHVFHSYLHDFFGYVYMYVLIVTTGIVVF